MVVVVLIHDVVAAVVVPVPMPMYRMICFKCHFNCPHRVIKCVSFIKHQLTRSVITVQYFKGFGLYCVFIEWKDHLCSLDIK